MIHYKYLPICCIPQSTLPPTPSQAEDNNSAGDYEGARSCGRAALGCNIVAIVYFILLILAGVTGALVYFFYIRQHLSEFEKVIDSIVYCCTEYPLRYNCNRNC